MFCTYLAYVGAKCQILAADHCIRLPIKDQIIGYVFVCLFLDRLPETTKLWAPWERRLQIEASQRRRTVAITLVAFLRARPVVTSGTLPRVTGQRSCMSLSRLSVLVLGLIFKRKAGGCSCDTSASQRGLSLWFQKGDEEAKSSALDHHTCKSLIWILK